MSVKKSILLIFFLIIILAGLAFWQFLSFKRSLTNVSLPEFKMPEMNLEMFSEEGKEPKEWTSPDEKLKLKYPGNWMEMKELVEKFNQETVQLSEAKILLFVFGTNLKNFSTSFLVVQELNLGNTDEIVEKIKKDVEGKNGKMEIIKSEIEDKNAYFEARYQRENYNLHSKERILIAGENSYLVSVFALEKDWSETEKEAEEILNSAQLIQ